MKKININHSQYLELEKILSGAFSPLSGFMTEAELISVVETMRITNGQIFSLPVLLATTEDDYNLIKFKDIIKLVYRKNIVASIEVEDIFEVDFKKILPKIFGTNDLNHPGMKIYLNNSNKFLGGKVLKTKNDITVKSYEKSPTEIKKIIKAKKFKTVAGFQTRNIPHKAHEYLHKLALEFVDCLFIHPITGKKKIGDFTNNTVLSSYKYLINNYYPKERVILSPLNTFMRYAGPREAVFHAIIRRNYGCTHFIVGRDHAGVGAYYKEYEAQKLCLKLEKEINIKILPFKGPYYCRKCNNIVTANCCQHSNINKYKLEISGTMIRGFLKEDKPVDENLIRPDLINQIKRKSIFIK